MDTDYKPRILVVDDEPLNLEIIMHSLDTKGYEVKCTADAEQTLVLLHNDNESFDVILLDRQLPGMDGLELLKRIKKSDKLKYIPVIMQTAMGKESDRREGIEAGAYYYLSKPYDSKSLLDIVESAVGEALKEKNKIDELRRSTVIYDLIDNCTLKVHSIGDVERASNYLANLFPDPEKVSYGIYALILNAVEHGNLGLGHYEKGRLEDEAAWVREIEERQSLPENTNKIVVVKYHKDGESIHLTIEDEGKGFDWRSFIYVDPQRAEQDYGRSIAITNMRCFDELKYEDPGNKVTATVLLNK